MWDNVVLFGSIFAIAFCVLSVLFPRTGRPPTASQAGYANARVSKSQTRQEPEVRRSSLIAKFDFAGREKASRQGQTAPGSPSNRKGERLMQKQTR